MIIGIDGSRAFLEQRTGTENYSYQLIKNMSLIDTQNRYLIYIRRGQNPGRDWPENFKFQILNFKFLWTQVGLALQTFIDPLDVLFVPSHTLPLIRKPSLKTVITVHDLGAEYLPRLHQLKQRIYLKLMTLYQIKTASRIISVSKATKKDLMKKIGLESEKIGVVYEGVDKTVFKQIPNDAVNDIVKKYDLERGKYFLFVGTVQPRKNLERLIRAFNVFQKTQKDPDLQKMRKSEIRNSYNTNSSEIQSYSEFSGKRKLNIKLVLVGNKGWKSDDIYKLPKELGIEDRVRFLGRVSDQELTALYNGAIALTYPSLFEGFGLPILESFACGCPVITSNTSSMAEIAGDAAILVNPESEEGIFKGMLSLYQNDSQRLSLINKGILRCKNFDWKDAARKTIDILEKTVRTDYR